MEYKDDITGQGQRSMVACTPKGQQVKGRGIRDQPETSHETQDTGNNWVIGQAVHI